MLLLFVFIIKSYDLVELACTSYGLSILYVVIVPVWFALSETKLWRTVLLIDVILFFVIVVVVVVVKVIEASSVLELIWFPCIVSIKLVWCCFVVLSVIISFLLSFARGFLFVIAIIVIVIVVLLGSRL